jgi:hypothetical protein
MGWARIKIIIYRQSIELMMHEKLLKPLKYHSTDNIFTNQPNWWGSILSFNAGSSH